MWSTGTLKKLNAEKKPKEESEARSRAFKYLDKGRQIDLNRLLWHTITTYGLSAIFEQLIDLLDGPKPYEKRLVADLKKAFANYEARYELDPEE